MRARLIANPSSGTDRAPEVLRHVNERLRTVVADLDITMTTCEEDVLRAWPIVAHFRLRPLAPR